MNFQTLRPLILTKLNTLVGTGQPLQCAYKAHTEKVTGYPAATFEPSSSESQFYTNIENLREFSFDIILWQEMKVAGREDAIDNLCKAVDAIIVAFEGDNTLTGVGGFHYTKPVSSQWGEIVGQAGPIKFCKLTITCGVEIAV